MPRYFFDIRDGTYIPDETGTELPGLDAARREAVSLSAGLLRDSAVTFWNGDEWKIEVKDDTGLILFSLMFVAVDAPAAALAVAAH
jgi:hypothetical protein